MGNKNAPHVKFFEEIPGVGHVVSATHAIAGNGNEARRAAGVSSANGLVLGGNIIAPGNPAAGAAAMAGGGILNAAVKDATK